MRLLVIGGSDAGISAALRAHELEPEVAIDLVLADAFPNYSICGLPFFLSGETPDWHMLAHRTTFDGITIHPEHRAERIDLAKRKVYVTHSAGAREFSYDRLLLGTGARPRQLSIPGEELPGVFLLHTMNDSFRVNDFSGGGQTKAGCDCRSRLHRTGDGGCTDPPRNRSHCHKPSSNHPPHGRCAIGREGRH